MGYRSRSTLSDFPRSALGTICVLGAVLIAHAAQAEPTGVVVRAARPDDADDVTSTTRIVIDESRAQVASVADAIAGEAGVRVRSRGGVGAFSSVSIRGSEAAEVAVLLDGVPISRSGFGLIDLSQLPIEGLERIEIHRGAAPLGFGSEAIGGAINLVTRRATTRPVRSGTAGGGSFGARLAGVRLGESFGARWRGLVTATYRGATGDFWYFDNGGTLFSRADDRERPRRNNGFDQLGVSATLGHTGRFDTQLALHGFWRRAGVPGFATIGAETVRARLDTARLIATARTQGLLGHDVRMQLLPSVELERLQFDNPRGELVGPFGAASQETLVVAGGVQARFDRRFPRHQLGTISAELRGEGRWATNLIGLARSADPAARVMWGVGIADQATLLGDRLLVDAALRVDGLGSFVADDERTREHRVFVSPRLGVRGRPHPLLTLRASGGRYVRNPTLLELFGDGGLTLPATDLKSESAWGGELGVHLEGRRTIVKGLVDIAGFGRYVTNLITYVPGQNASTAINIGAASVGGAELRGALSVASHLSLKLDYTLLDARNRSGDASARGKRLPGRAAHEAKAALELAALGVRLAYTAHYVGVVYRDERNLNPLPSYVLHDLGIHYQYGLLAFSLDVTNVGDLRTRPLPLGGSAQSGQSTPYPLVDVFNYPLPGRAVYATVTVSQ